DAAVATIPIPRKISERAALAGDLVDITADILDAHDPILEQDAVNRLPFRKVILPIASAGPLTVFLGQMRMQRPVSLRPDGGRERMIVGLGVVTNDFHFLFHKPFSGRWHEAGRPTEIVFAVLVEFVPAGVNDHHVAWTNNLAASFFQIVAGNRLPLVLRDRHHDSGTKEMRQWYFVDEWRALYNMRRRIDMGGVVHRSRDAL